MARARFRFLHVRIPPYTNPRNEWRRKVQNAVWAEMAEKSASKRLLRNSNLDIRARIYFMSKKELNKHDVDNRLKDIMDALQGRMGGSKADSAKTPLIINDARIFKVSISKHSASKQNRGWGHLEIREYRRSDAH